MKIIFLENSLIYLIIVIGIISCSSDENEVTPKEKLPPTFNEIEPTDVLPGDTLSIKFDNANTSTLEFLKIKGVDSEISIIDSSTIKVKISEDIEFQRSERLEIEALIEDKIINSSIVKILPLEIKAINLDTIVFGDTIYIEGSNFYSDIDEVYIGRASNFTSESEPFLNEIQILAINSDEIKVLFDKNTEIDKYNNYVIGLRVNDIFYRYHTKVFYGAKARRSRNFNGNSLAPGSLLQFDYFDGSYYDDSKVIIKEKDTLKNPLFHFSENGYRRATYEVPVDYSLDTKLDYTVFANNTKLRLEKEEDIRVIEGTYSFTPETISGYEDVTFELSHVYFGGSYIINLIDQNTGEISVTPPNSLIDESVKDNGDGVILTVTVPTFDKGSYYVQIIAGEQDYELQPSANNVLTIE